VGRARAALRGRAEGGRLTTAGVATVLGVAAAHPRLSALAGALCIASAGILVRVSGVGPASATVFRCGLAILPLLLLAVAEERRIGRRSRRQMAVGLVAGVCFGLDLTAFHAAIGVVGAGLATILANLQVVIVGVVAWLAFGERPSIRLVVATLLALAGVVLISGVVGGVPYGADPIAGVAYGLTAATFYAAYLLILRAGIGDPQRVSGPILDATVASAATGLVIGLLLGGLDLTPGWPAIGWLIVLALVAQVAAGQLILVSLPRLPAVLTSIILLAQPVATVLLAVVLLGERPSVAQWLGVGFVLAGLSLASLRGRTAAEGSPQPAPG
jgi:drug/metabolite transporter (DMT)-like permease